MDDDDDDCFDIHVPNVRPNQVSLPSAWSAPACQPASLPVCLPTGGHN